MYGNRTRLIGIPLALVVATMLLFEAAASRLIRSTDLCREVLEIQTPTQLLAKLSYLKHFDGRKIVLLGDSLVYGQTMERYGDANWRSHVLSSAVEKKLRAKQPDERLLVMNLGINGARPADLEVLTKLVVGCGVDLVILDIHLRPFSEDFAATDKQFCRPWLEHFNISETGRIRYDPPSAEQGIVRHVLRDIQVNSSSLCQFGDILKSRVVQSSIMQSGVEFRDATDEETTPQMEDAMLLLMRIKSRLDSVNFRENHPQVLAFRRTLAFLKEEDQACLIFYGRENPDQIHSVISQGRYRQLRSRLEHIIATDKGPRTNYMPPADGLTPSHYLDFMHLNAAGYDLLAERLVDQEPARRLSRGPRPHGGRRG